MSIPTAISVVGSFATPRAVVVATGLESGGVETSAEASGTALADAVVEPVSFCKVFKTTVVDDITPAILKMKTLINEN